MRSPSSRVSVALAMMVLVVVALGGDGRRVVALADSPQAVRYDMHKLVRVEVTSARDLRTMAAIGAVTASCRVGIGAMDFVVSPEQLNMLTKAGLAFTVLAQDMQALIDFERHLIEQARQSPLAAENWFSVYREWDEVNDYIDELVALRPDLVKKKVIGTSVEGRTIYGMKVSGPGNTAGRPGILYNGCQHAREWISVMVPMYIADRLVRDYDTDPQIQQMVDSIEFHIIPIVNPDGYEFTYAEGGDRLWRKNRNPNPGLQCVGVDLNRNWNADWNGPHSTSTNSCSFIYVGSAPHSEPEVAALAAYMDARPNLVLHVDYHNYSELILYPYGFTDSPPSDIKELETLAIDMREAIYDVNGVDYAHGTPGDVLYFASGLMQDWAYGQGMLSYTIELRPSTVPPGFLLPPEEIMPTSEENMAGVLVMAEWVIENHGFSADLTGDGSVGVADLLVLLGQWGPCNSGDECTADLTGDGQVNVADLLLLLGAWGSN